MRFLSLLLTFVFSAGAAFAMVQPGQPAPEFTGTDSHGNAISLSDFKGKPVVLEWTNHKCPFVKKHYKPGNMQQLQTMAKEDGVVWLSIISSAKDKQGYVSSEEANRITAEKGATPAHVILDPAGDIGRAYGAKTTPHMFVINAEGTLVYAGAIDDKPSADPADIAGATNYVTAALTAIKNGEEISTTSTQPYGCSVKY